MTALISQIFPILYGACFLVLLWQAFKVMGQGFRAVPRPGDLPPPRLDPGDRTGRVTIHPELLDEEGQLTHEDLLTVRFGADPDPRQPPAPPAE
ncbi:MAG: DUF2973 domain-containing protein [Cyanobacteriota bacterium]|nr:DUF2973 domain-containing protein [Cyanobacteriota bacterium]